MPKVSEIERAIWERDGIRAVFRAPRDRRLPSALPYQWDHAAPGSTSLRQWRELRLEPSAGGIEVDVISGEGVPANQDTTLESLRDSYLPRALAVLMTR